MPKPNVDHGEQEALRTIGQPRSPEWPKVEKAHLEIEPTCACCGKSTAAGLQVHHKFPFHYCIALGRPDLELDPRNLITLCEDEEGEPGQNHHLLVGHLDDFQSSNLDVVTDARTTFHGMTADAIRGSDEWKRKVAGRIKPLDQMSEEDKADFRKRMDDAFPRE